jgi:hypothetical protein
MKFSFKLTHAQLKVFSAVMSNFVAFWFAAILATKDIFVLTLDLIMAILSWKLAVKSEEVLEKL